MYLLEIVLIQNKTKNCKPINSKETVELLDNVFNNIPLWVLDTFENRHIETILAMWTETVCSCHVTYAFQSESTLYSYLNVKELLARSRHEIWILSDSNWNQTQNHLVCKRTLNHLAKWLSVRLRTKWLWVRFQLQSLEQKLWEKKPFNSNFINNHNRMISFLTYRISFLIYLY